MNVEWALQQHIETCVDDYRRWSERLAFYRRERKANLIAWSQKGVCKAIDDLAEAQTALTRHQDFVQAETIMRDMGLVNGQITFRLKP